MTADTLPTHTLTPNRSAQFTKQGVTPMAVGHYTDTHTLTPHCSAQFTKQGVHAWLLDVTLTHTLTSQHPAQFTMQGVTHMAVGRYTNTLHTHTDTSLLSSITKQGVTHKAVGCYTDTHTDTSAQSNKQGVTCTAEKEQVCECKIVTNVLQ